MPIESKKKLNFFSNSDKSFGKEYSAFFFADSNMELPICNLSKPERLIYLSNIFFGISGDVSFMFFGIHIFSYREPPKPRFRQTSQSKANYQNENLEVKRNRLRRVEKLRVHNRKKLKLTFQ